MDSLGVKVFFIDAIKSPDFHDYLICEVDGEFYALAWRWDETQRFRRGSVIEGCDLFVGKEMFQFYKEKWEAAINKLITSDELEIAHKDAVLTARPDKKLVEQMRLTSA